MELSAQRPFLGIAIALLGCCTAATGYTLQKVAHIKTAKANQYASQRSPYWRRWEFVAGSACLGVASALAIITFSLAGQAELAPMGAVTLVAQELLAWWVLREPFTRVDGVAVALMSIGTTLALATAKSSKQQYSVELITALILRPVCLLSCAVIGAVLVALASFVAAVGNAPASTLPPGTANLDAMSRSVIAGLLGGFTSTLGKASSVLVFTPLVGGHFSAVLQLESWFCIVSLVCVVSVQMRYLNSGLGRYDALRIAP
jgi:uncharacterized membrane protein